jgi:hypothetical protein
MAIDEPPRAKYQGRDGEQGTTGGAEKAEAQIEQVFYLAAL